MTPAWNNVTGTNSVTTTYYPLDGWGSGSTSSMMWCGNCACYVWGHHACHTAHQHDFHQAAAPHQSTLFCRTCGETKQLKASKATK